MKTVKLHRPATRLFAELQHYQDLSSAGAAALINRSQYATDHVRELARDALRVTFKRRRPWRERVATRRIGLLRFNEAQHSPERFALFVSINELGGMGGTLPSYRDPVPVLISERDANTMRLALATYFRKTPENQLAREALIVASRLLTGASNARVKQTGVCSETRNFLL